jgi:hypothetical protein
MSVFDAVDGAHSAASKCNTELKRRWAIQGGEVTADGGTDDMELKVLTNWRGHDDVMQTRSFRGSGEPARVIASFNACLRLGPVRAEHYGERPHRPHKQAGHMTAPDQCCRNVRKLLPGRRPHMTQSGRQRRRSSFPRTRRHCVEVMLTTVVEVGMLGRQGWRTSPRCCLSRQGCSPSALS